MLTSTTKNRLYTLASILALVLVWKLLAIFWHQELILPSPERTVHTLWLVLIAPDFWPAVAATVGRGLFGFLISCLAAVVLGVAAGFSAPVYWLLRPWVTVVRTTPVMSVVILAIIWFSSNMVPIFVAFLMIFPIIYGNVVAGIKNVDPQLLEMANMYRVKTKRVIGELYLPSIVPYLLAGASNGMGLTWKVIIAAEILSQPLYAIGTNLMVAKIYLETAQVMAWTVVVIVISFIFEHLINAVENKLKMWG
jgi:NitT/TauT family transport system permease protein